MEKPGGLQSMGSQRVRHDLAVQQLHLKCSFCLVNKLICTIFFCFPCPDWKVSVRSSDSCQLKVKLSILADALPRQHGKAFLLPLPACLRSKETSKACHGRRALSG